MKTSLFLFLPFILIAATVNAQTLTASEMISKTKCTSFECYNEFIVKKGFSFEKSFAADDATSYLFMSDNYIKISNSGGEVKNSSAISITNNKKNTSVGFGTGNKEHYNKLLKAFQILGFKSISNTPNANGILIVYESKKYPKITLMITVGKSSHNDQTWTSYDFQAAAWR